MRDIHSHVGASMEDLSVVVARDVVSSGGEGVAGLLGPSCHQSHVQDENRRVPDGVSDVSLRRELELGRAGGETVKVVDRLVGDALEDDVSDGELDEGG